MKVLVTGDRNWRDAIVIYEALRDIPVARGELRILIHGDANGADVIAGACAQLLGWDEIRPYPADWKLGKRAGVIRNQQMLEENPDLVLAFHSDLANSKGTADMVRRAEKAGITTVIITGSD